MNFIKQNLHALGLVAVGVLFSVVLAACGGGGGGSSAEAPPTTPGQTPTPTPNPTPTPTPAPTPTPTPTMTILPPLPLIASPEVKHLPPTGRVEGELSFDSADEQDLYAFSLEAGQFVAATTEVTSGPSMQLEVRLYSESGQEIPARSESTASLRMFRAPQRGNYYLAVSTPPSATQSVASVSQSGAGGPSVQGRLKRAVKYLLKFIGGRVEGAANSFIDAQLCKNWLVTLGVAGPPLALTACVAFVLDYIEGRVTDGIIRAYIAALRVDNSVPRPTIAPASPLQPNQQFTLTAMVRSKLAAGVGPNAVAARATHLQFYRTGNAGGRISRGDMPVGQRAVAACNTPVACAARQSSISLAAPSAAGTYYYGACVTPRFNEGPTEGFSNPATDILLGPIPPLADLTENNCSEKVRVVITRGSASRCVIFEGYGILGSSNVDVRDICKLGVDPTIDPSAIAIISNACSAPIRVHYRRFAPHKGGLPIREQSPDVLPGSRLYFARFPCFGFGAYCVAWASDPRPCFTDEHLPPPITAFLPDGG